jgi:hypothetical protein
MYMGHPLYAIPTQGTVDKGEPHQATSPIPIPVDRQRKGRSQIVILDKLKDRFCSLTQIGRTGP